MEKPTLPCDNMWRVSDWTCADCGLDIGAAQHHTRDECRIRQIATLRAALQAAEKRASEAESRTNAIAVESITTAAKLRMSDARVAALEEGLRQTIPYIERHAQCSNPQLLATLRTLLRGDGEKPKCGTCGGSGMVTDYQGVPYEPWSKPCPACAADEKK